MKILDLTAGNRAIWFDREHPCATYVDVRAEVGPDIVADSIALPAEIGCDYNLIIFDPPHKTNGKSFGMSRSYGSFSMEQIRALLRGAATEAHRVASADALMAFKWNDHHLQLKKALSYLAEWWEPLVGHGMRPQQRAGSNTSWVLLRKIERTANA